jgi:hypothetical protein
VWPIFRRWQFLSDLTKFIDFICRAPRQQAPVIILSNFQPELKLMRCNREK